MASRVYFLGRQLWTDNSLLAATTSVVSSWVDLEILDSLRIGRTATGGTYEFRIEWSRDGATVDMTEIITPFNDSTTVEKKVAARFARFRVHNTNATTAFTAHRTNVFAR